MRRRLSYVEGLRGVAAMVVCLNHVVYLVPGMPPGSEEIGPAWLRLLLRPFIYGGEMVALFLLLSGFTLYYAEGLRRLGGLGASTAWQFARRRAWRILPLYYAAFAFGVAATMLFRRSDVQTGSPVESDVDLAGVASHVLLIHNTDPDWVFQGNAPLWSIAYESQVYVLFPLILWLAHRFGFWAALTAVALPLSVLGHLDPARPVFGLIGWFAVGMGAAHGCLRGMRLPGQAGGALAVLLLVVGVWNPTVVQSGPAHDLVWGGAFVLIVLSAYAGGLWDAALSTRPLRWLGRSSYSLYAVNYPVVLLVLMVGQGLGVSGLGLLVITMVIALPLAIGVGQFAFRRIEEPSLARVRGVR